MTGLVSKGATSGDDKSYFYVNLLGRLKYGHKVPMCNTWDAFAECEVVMEHLLGDD